MHPHRSPGQALAAALACAFVPAAFGAEDPAPVQHIEVTGASQRSSYLQRDGNTAAKLDVDVRDVPASLQTLSPQLIRDQAAGQSLNAVLHNASGVSQTYGSGTGNLPAVSIRGFDTGGYALVDGYPRANGATYDWSSIDRLEVLKGPASLLYGMQYNIGGSINVVTKKPGDTPVAEASVEVGRWDHYRSSLDLGGPLGQDGTWAWRFNGAVDRSRSFRSSVYEQNDYLAPSARWRPDASDSVLLRGDLHRRRYVPDPGLPGPGSGWAANDLAYWYPGPARDRMGLDLPIAQYTGLPWFDRYTDDNRTLTLEWTHTFNEQWTLKTGLSPAWTDYQGQYSGFWWEQPTDEAGNPLPVVSHLSAGRYGYGAREVPVNLDLTGDFVAAGLAHKLLVGFAWNHGRWHDSGPANNTSLVPVESVGLLDWLRGPRYSFVADPDFPGSDYTYYQRTEGLYVQDLVSLGEAWKVLVGYRYDRAKGGWRSTYGTDVYEGEFESRGGTPRLGIVWQPSRTTSLYASWSRSFNPNWGRLVDGSLPPPEKGVQFEMGWKQDFADGRANLNVAIYSLVKRNVERCAPQDPDCRLYVLGGEQGSKGLEIDLNGEPLPHLRLTSSLTLQTGARVRKDLPADSPSTWGGALPVGNTFPGGPHRIFNFFAVYAFEEGPAAGLELGGGFNYASASEQNLPNDGHKLPGERTVNLYGAYALTPAVRVQLNLNNATNDIAYSSPGWQGWPWLYFANKPRELVLTLTSKW